MKAVIFHIDVNSAFLSWSALKKLNEGSAIDLRTIPSIIGGDIEKRHGVVLAKSIPAKVYDIHTGEPVVNAFRKCPNLVSEPPDHHYYSKMSHMLMDFLSDICPEIEQVSIDECYMDFTPIASAYESPVQAAAQIKNSIFETFGFTVNIGISDRKVLAKMASDFKKPNLVHTLFHDEIKEKMWQLPLSSLYMCGHSSVEALRKLGLLTIGDLALADPNIIVSHLKSHGKVLWEFANGIDDSVVNTVPEKAKGIGNSTTLTRDASTREEACKVLLSLAESVSRRLREVNQCATQISIEIKYNTFKSVSHQVTLPTPTNATDKIFQNACALFDQLWDETPIRLLGLRTTKLQDVGVPVQMNLFDLPVSDVYPLVQKSSPKPEKLEKLDFAMDSIRQKYGQDSIVRGSLLKSKKEITTS